MTAISKSTRADLDCWRGPDCADISPNILTDALPMRTRAAFHYNDFTKPPAPLTDNPVAVQLRYFLRRFAYRRRMILFGVSRPRH